MTPCYYCEEPRTSCKWCIHGSFDSEECEKTLSDAATSLETVEQRSYGDNPNLSELSQVRGYAGSRARVIREFLKGMK